MKRLALILVTALLLASLPISIATAEDCQIKYMLVDEQVSDGEFIRVYKTLDDCGYGLQSSLQHLSGVSGDTPYEAEMEIIERGLGRFLMLPPETVDQVRTCLLA